MHVNMYGLAPKAFLLKSEVKEVRRRRQGKGSAIARIKARWKQWLAGARLDFFLLRQRCIIYRRWWRQAASDGAEQRRRAAPFLFCGSIPSGQALCWLDGCLWGNPCSYWAESEGRTRLARTETQQRYSSTMSVTAMAGEQKKRMETEWQRMGE